MDEKKNTTWREIKERRGYESLSLDEQIEAARQDAEFRDRLDRLMDENREVLDRLAE